MLQKLFLTFVEISISLLPIIFLLMIASSLMGKRYSSGLRCLLWIVLTGRLLIPLNLPFSQAVNLFMPFAKQSAKQLWFIPPPITMLENTNMQNINQANYLQNATIFSSANVLSILTIVWLTIAVVILIYHFATYLLVCRKLNLWSTAILDEDVLFAFQRIKRELKISRNIRLYQSSKAASPLLVGLIRPRIIIPEHALTAEQLDFMLCHELVHYRRRDLWFKLILLIACSVHWFNPLVYLMSRQVNLDIEIACDADVLAGADSDKRKLYGLTILSFFEQGWRHRTPLTTHFLGGNKQILRRFGYIADGRAKKRGTVLFCVISLIIVISGGVVTASADSQESAAIEQAQVADKTEIKTQFIWPTLNGYISTQLNGYAGHTGIDIAIQNGTGTPIFAAADGTVSISQETNVGYGKYIVIDHGNGYTTLYAHNDELLVSVGDKVNQGQTIAKMGRTGRATGVALHFEVRYNEKILDPEDFIPKAYMPAER